MRRARWVRAAGVPVIPTLFAALSLRPCRAGAPPQRPSEVRYVARFEMEKAQYLLGGPVFVKFTIENTGGETFQFAYRSPSRVLNRGLESEPRFRITDAAGQTLPDPAPTPCGGMRGTVVYGSVTLPPGQIHTERWLLNQWGRFTSPGQYHLRAERRLPLLALDPRTQEASKRPAAFALALNELSFEMVAGSEAAIRSSFALSLDALRRPTTPDRLAEAVLVLTTLPKPFFLKDLEAMTLPGAAKRWDRRAALEGMARLGTPEAWQAILRIARGNDPCSPKARAGAAPAKSPASRDISLRSYAILLLAEKGDPAFLPTLLDIMSNGPDPLREHALRALGFFRDPRAIDTLYQKLHSDNPSDRMNAILGLKTLGTKETLPALMAMLNDPAPQVRQVANFALQGLTGEKFKLSAKAEREESARVAAEWHAWWRVNAASFSPSPPPPCREW